LRHNRVEASSSDVTDFSAQKDDLPVDRTSVDTSLVCVVHNNEVVENLVDVLFPRSTGFGVPVQGLEKLVAPTSGQLPFHDESDTSRRRHRQSERVSVGQARGRRHRRKCSPKLGTQHRNARWGRATYTEYILLLVNVLLLVSVELFPFRGRPEIPNRELLELATGEGTKTVPHLYRYRSFATWRTSSSLSSGSTLETRPLQPTSVASL
jgi:hypothetical protein